MCVVVAFLLLLLLFCVFFLWFFFLGGEKSANKSYGGWMCGVGGCNILIVTYKPI